MLAADLKDNQHVHSICVYCMFLFCWRYVFGKQTLAANLKNSKTFCFCWVLITRKNGARGPSPMQHEHVKTAVSWLPSIQSILFILSGRYSNLIPQGFYATLQKYHKSWLTSKSQWETKLCVEGYVFSALEKDIGCRQVSIHRTLCAFHWTKLGLVVP